MKKEDFERYFNKKIPIEFWLKLNQRHPYKGVITHLSNSCLVLKENKLGEITIDYSDILSPIKTIKENKQ